MKKMFVFVALACVAAFVAACSKGLSGYCSDSIDLSCERVFTCLDGGTYATKADCVKVFKTLADGGDRCTTIAESDFCPDGGSVDYSKLDKCYADTKALTCSSTTIPASCTERPCK